MKTQIVVTVELDHNAQFRDLLPPAPQIAVATVLAEINTELRQWAASNPFSLREPEHLRLTLCVVNGAPAVRPDYAPKLAGDLRRMAGDLNALANITENL